MSTPYLDLLREFTQEDLDSHDFKSDLRYERLFLAFADADYSIQFGSPTISRDGAICTLSCLLKLAFHLGYQSGHEDGKQAGDLGL